MVKERHAREREALLERQRVERGALGEGTVVMTDFSAVEAEVSAPGPPLAASVNGGKNRCSLEASMNGGKNHCCSHGRFFRS